jgi:sterol desaturase/sphingolipid hydroxylase (fatty acid hydroxylase superfamily)
MDTSVITSAVNSVMQQGQWLLSLYVFAGALAVFILGKYLLLLVPALNATRQLNVAAARERVTRSYYPPIQNRSKRWGLLTQLAVFILIVPFNVTAAAQPWWKVLLDIVIILMVYDFFYYLVHRFLFHDGPLGAPLKWVHAVHHQMKNPCRMDSAYLHPIETCLGIALYGVTFAALASVLGDFHVITAITTFVAFSAINQHNHDLMEVDHFPFKYLKYMSDMHHVHHARFIGGNFATISLLYDWLFGTYDTGNGWGKHKRSPAPQTEAL